MKRYSSFLPKKDTRLAIRLSEEKIKQFQYFAKLMGTTTSDFVRISCELARRYPDLFKEFRAYGYLPSLTVENKKQ